MAFYLYKFIRRKIRENEAKKAVPTTDDFHLLPEITPVQGRQQISHQNPQNGAIGIEAPRHSYVHQISAEEMADQKAEARKRNIRQMKLMLGLALPNFLASIDVTIVAPAIPIISSHFSMMNSTTNVI
jgi:uncharacterized membrane protein